VDSARFQEAQQAYDAKDYRTAAKGFLAAAGRGAEGNGAAYHMAGNSLMRLRRYQDAVTVYGHALRDPIYDRRGAVFANLGAAQAALGDYVEAVRAYESALAEQDYATPYKAYQGMAGALLERGHVEDAAVAYRKAALDPGNPDPGKALVNLGLCFMALKRPADAAEAYRAALGFDEYKGRGKALSNLGQAYVALGEYEEADRAFEKATQLHGHQLSAAAAAAWEVAQNHLKPDSVASHETVEGWQTGEIPHVVLPEDGSSAEWSTEQFGALGTPLSAEPAAPSPAPAPPPVSAAAPAAPAAPTARAPSEPETPSAAPIPSRVFDAEAAGVSAGALAGTGETASDLGHPEQADHAAASLGFGDEEAVADFFSATEEELKQRDREARRQHRSENRGGTWRSVLATVLIVVVVLGALAAAYYFGLGWPTQQQTVSGMLVAHGNGGSVEKYWVSVPTTDISKEMAKIPPQQTFSIDGVSMHPKTSTVAITVTPKNGAPLHYVVTLQRQGVGWYVSGVDNDWRSTGSGS